MVEVPTKLGKNLKRIRTAKKLSQGTISRNLEIHRAYISEIESGLSMEKEIPRLRQFRK